MKILSLIGNCQMVTLCFYLQQLLDPSEYKVNWLSYGPEFEIHLGKWSQKCQNKIRSHDDSIKELHQSDFVLYQEVKSSKIANPAIIGMYKKNTTQVYKFPSVYLDFGSYEASIKELKFREINGSVDIKASEIFERNRHKTKNELMLTTNHPTTYFFMEFLRIIASKLNFSFFTDEMVKCFMNDNNYMELPPYFPTRLPKIICTKNGLN